MRKLLLEKYGWPGQFRREWCMRDIERLWELTEEELQRETDAMEL